MPAFTAAIEAHQRRITEAILDHALKICSDKNVSPIFISLFLFYLVLDCYSFLEHFNEESMNLSYNAWLRERSSLDMISSDELNL